MSSEPGETGQWEVVRIYFNQLHSAGPYQGFWRRVTSSPTALSLAREALNEGVTFAVATLGAAGFVRGARHVTTNMGEVVPENLPSCLELVGPMGLIRNFLESRKAFLADAIVMRMEGRLILSEAQMGGARNDSALLDSDRRVDR